MPSRWRATASQVLVAFQDVENALVRPAHARRAGRGAGPRHGSRATCTLQLSQDQYRNGAVTFLDVVDAERTLFSKAHEFTNIAQRMQDSVLIKALGGGVKATHPGTRRAAWH